MKKIVWHLCLLSILSIKYTKAQITRIVGETTSNETLPEYPGGYPAFHKHLNKTFKFPKSVARAGYMGPVLITMIVDTDGRTIVDSLDFSKLETYRKKTPNDELKAKSFQDLEHEIRKVFDTMPRWKPGVQEGRPVRVKYTLPYNLFYE